MSGERIDLERGGLRAWTLALKAATDLGYVDEQGKVPASPTGQALALRFTTGSRLGHEKYLRKAYSAGRFHFRMVNNRSKRSSPE